MEGAFTASTVEADRRNDGDQAVSPLLELSAPAGGITSHYITASGPRLQILRQVNVQTPLREETCTAARVMSARSGI